MFVISVIHMETEELNISKIERKIWEMILLAVVVILFLTLTLLGLQFLGFIGESEVILLSEHSYKYSVFLSIIVLLFCAYVIIEQRKLLHLSRAFSKEKETTQTLSQSVKTLSALLEVTSSINSQQKLSDIFNTITKEVLSCFQADHSSIMLFDEQSKTLEPKASFWKGAESDNEALVPLVQNIAGWVAKSGKPLLLNGKLDTAESHEEQRRNGPITSSLCAPLKIGEKSIGVLNVNLVDSPRTFSETDLKLISVFANNAAVAIHDAELYEQIKSFNVRLEEKVKERTLELEAANKVKSDFLASVSHELRTPLTAIIGFSQVLINQHFGTLNQNQEEYVRDILESGERLHSLINDVLDLSNIEAGKVELELSQVKVSELLQNSLIMIKQKSLEHGISTDLQIPQKLGDLQIKADERKLKQVMFNLLSNAVKFTPDNGSIRVEANLISDFDEYLSSQDTKTQRKLKNSQSSIINLQSSILISVADTGIGIAPEDQEKIFDEFHQVRSGISDKTPGTGLGLSLTKRLVEMHGGRIWVESEGEGKGARFGFVLPVKSENQ
jgi:signal transduction histidine kinase